METLNIIQEIQQLPLDRQIYIAERILKTIRKKEIKSEMEHAANKLYKEYISNNELTIFTDIDFEQFYETTK
jgi:hypothetical protein